MKLINRSYGLLFITFFSFLLFTLRCRADVPIRYLGVAEGLSNSSVNCITQDQYGFIWLGTYDGLNQYDGFDFKIFRNRWKDNRSLINNHVKAIDALGNRIFVGTEKGLNYYDYTDLKFHSLYYFEGKRKVKIDVNVNRICHDRSGNIFVATSKLGLLKFRSQDTIGTRIAGGNFSGNYAVYGMTLDKNDYLWVLAENKGLGLFDRKTSKIILQNTEQLTANSMTTDGKGQVWIGSNSGLFIYNVGKRELHPFSFASQLTAQNISHLLYVRGEMWISTNGSGINIWNPAIKQMRYVMPGESRFNLRSGAVASSFEDDEGRIWVATLRGEVSVIDRRLPPFQAYGSDAFNVKNHAGNFMRAFCEDQRHNIWIGTAGNGLNYWNRKSNSFTNFSHKADGKSISSNLVVSVLKDYQNQIWVATFNGGIDRFNEQTQQFQHYPCWKPGTASEEKNIWKLFEDSEHRLWASSTWGGALYQYNRTAGRFEIFDEKLIDIHTLFQDSKGRLWGGNYTQLIRIDPYRKRTRFFFIGQPVRALTEDKAGKLWIGTEGGGLVAFDTDRSQIKKRFTERDGLPSNSILNILTDDHNKLWCSTYNGLTCFDQSLQKFTNYFTSDGLQSNQFLYNAALKLHSGDMLFGGIRGFNLFFPDSIKAYAHQPRLRITDFKINGTPLQQSTYSSGSSLNNVKKIKIPFSAASLQIGFTALEYTNPEKISYAYLLEGWDQHWNFVGKIRSASFSRLNEGTYVLKIKSTRTDGTWNDNALSVTIEVLPPWYRTWWSYVIYLSLIALCIYIYILYRKHQFQLKYDIKIANLEREREKEISERKLSFFTNVSHEFRTPLTLIVNPIKDMLKQSNGDNEELNIVYRNARRLLGLVDHLLLFRKTESENIELKICRINFVELCCDVFNCFSHQTKIKEINYVFVKSDEAIDVFADRAKIEIALFNLISNAVKFTPERGSIVVSVTHDDQNVYFEIKDNGTGIPSEIGEKLFEKYYQVRNSNSLKVGFGIGLYLVKTFVENHQGTISYKCNDGQGTTFILCLPKSLRLLSELDVTEPGQLQDSIVTTLIDHDNSESSTKERTAPHFELLISDKQSILIIDDNQEIRNYIKVILSNQFTVYEAQDGKQGLEIIAKNLPDVIISDIVMPGLNGLELCQLVKKDPSLSHIPIILLTGETTPDLQLRGLKEGAVDFISKPFDKELLIARVNGIIKNKKELQNYFYNEVTLKGSGQHISEETKAFLYKCIEVIESSLNDPSFEVNTLADRLGISYSNLYKKIKQITGLSINGFIRFVRLRKVAEILINTNSTINEAAFRGGFNDLKYFREHFNKQFGLNPSEFVKRHRNTFQKSYFMQ